MGAFDTQTIMDVRLPHPSSYTLGGVPEQAKLSGFFEN